MAALTGYFDDSRTDGLIMTVAGYIGSDPQWNVFQSQWSLVLDAFQLPYFHMKEFGDPDGPYKKWLPYQDHQAEIAAFFRALAAVSFNSQLRGFGSIVRVKDLERFNRDHGAALEAYPMAVYGCMLWIGKANPDAVISLIFDKIEQVSSKLDKATEYARSDTYYIGVTDKIQPIPLNKGITFRNVPALQAADFSAWEIRKHHLNQNEWWELPDRPADPNEALFDLMEWSQKELWISTSIA